MRKSTLIGRLLYDSKSVFQDQLEAVERSSQNKGFDYVDLSLLTDGLKSEREQGIILMSHTAIFPRQNLSLLLPIHQAILSTQEMMYNRNELKRLTLI